MSAVDQADVTSGEVFSGGRIYVFFERGEAGGVELLDAITSTVALLWLKLLLSAEEVMDEFDPGSGDLLQ